MNEGRQGKKKETRIEEAPSPKVLTMKVGDAELWGQLCSVRGEKKRNGRQGGEINLSAGKLVVAASLVKNGQDAGGACG